MKTTFSVGNSHIDFIDSLTSFAVLLDVAVMLVKKKRSSNNFYFLECDVIFIKQFIRQVRSLSESAIAALEIIFLHIFRWLSEIQ